MLGLETQYIQVFEASSRVKFRLKIVLNMISIGGTINRIKDSNGTNASFFVIYYLKLFFKKC